MTNETCPKCNEPRKGHSCSKCGLVFAKFDPRVLEGSASEEVRMLFEQVEEDWTNESKHAVFIERALMEGSGTFAVSCYRRHHGDPIATKFTSRITGRLEQMLIQSSTVPRGNPGRARLIGAILLLAFLGIISFLFFVMYR